MGAHPEDERKHAGPLLASASHVRTPAATDGIVLLGNDPRFLESLRDALVVHGWHAQVASSMDSVPEALVPALVVADVDSLQPDADRILEGLRRRWGRALRVLLIGSRLDLPELARATDVSAYLRTPFGMTDLLAAVDRASVGR
jgi:DNA-binding response OmpR family regulator